MNGKREETNAHGAGRVLSYEPLSVHCDACDRDYGSWESFGRHVDEIVDVESGFDPYVTDHGRIKCGCLAEFGDITEWRAHLAQAIIDNIDASEEGSETRDADE